MKKIDLDFTSLLDVMLILLFVFLLNSNAENSEIEEVANAQIKEIRQQEAKAIEDYLSSEAENRLLQAEIATKEKQYTDLLAQYEKLLSAPKTARQTWHNYEAVAQRFYFINISITAPDNRLTVNDKSYPLYITAEEAQNETLRMAKRKEIMDIIEKEIDQKEGGYQFVLLSSGKDLRIPRLVYTLLWEAIKDVEHKYGTEKVFKTEFELQ